MLVQAAANEWQVDAAQCSAKAGVIAHAASGRRTSYGKVAGAAGKLSVPTDVKLKDPKDWKIIGNPLLVACVSTVMAVVFGWIDLLYILGHWGVRLGLGLCGIKIVVVGREHLPRGRAAVPLLESMMRTL